jgi:hypothetical protein
VPLGRFLVVGEFDHLVARRQPERIRVLRRIQVKIRQGFAAARRAGSGRLTQGVGAGA